MARNRKHQSTEAWFRPAVICVLVCGILGGAGVGYVWQKGVLQDLGRQTIQRERQLATLSDQNEKLRKQLGYMRSPRYLEERIKDLKLGLAPPHPGQIWRLPEPVHDYPEAEKSTERQFAADHGRHETVR